jgi:hypothetical protein
VTVNQKANRIVTRNFSDQDFFRVGRVDDWVIENVLPQLTSLFIRRANDPQPHRLSTISSIFVPIFRKGTRATSFSMRRLRSSGIEATDCARQTKKRGHKDRASQNN